MSTGTDQDGRLLQLCRQGDEAAFETLFRKYQGYVFNVSLGMLGSSEDAGDIVQETFLRLHRRLDGFRGDSALSTWLHRVAVNLCLSELRRRRGRKFQLLEDVDHDDAATLNQESGPSPDELISVLEDRQVVRQVLATLPAEYRSVLVLRHFQQLAYEEMCVILDLPLNTVKSRLFRARGMFKDRFAALTGAAD